VGNLIDEEDFCAPATNEFDITLTVIGSGIVFVVLVLLYFICNTDCAKKRVKNLLWDALIVCFGIIGNWLNVATDVSTFVNIVFPNQDLSYLLYPVITIVIIGGITTIAATGVAIWILVELEKEAEETQLQKMSYLVRFTKEFGLTKATRLYEKYKDFHEADANDAGLESNKEWRPVFDVVFRVEEDELESKVRGQKNVNALPSKQVDSIMKVIRKIGREKQLLYINAWILFFQAIPMFVVTAWPIMSIAPERDIKGWIFRTSLLLGAVVIGTKAAKVMDYFTLITFEKRFRKQLYCTIMSVRTRSYDPDPEVAGISFALPGMKDLEKSRAETRPCRKKMRFNFWGASTKGNRDNRSSPEFSHSRCQDETDSRSRKARTRREDLCNIDSQIQSEADRGKRDTRSHYNSNGSKLFITNISFVS